MKIRYYQQEAIDALYNFFASIRDPLRNPVIALPTGTGKSVVIAAFIKHVMMRWPGQRIMMLTHVKELIGQNADKLLKLWPAAPLGLFSAGLGSKQANMPITFAGVQSAIKSIGLFAAQDILIIDECHLVGTDENASYLKLIAELRKLNPRLRVIGLTATPYRLGLGLITEGGIFTDIVYDATGVAPFNRLLAEGYLSPLIPMPTKTVFDLSGVKKLGGDFQSASLQKAMTREDLTKAAVREAMVAAEGRRAWLVFTTGVDHAEMTQRLLKAQGLRVGCIHSKMKGGRDEELQGFDEGYYDALVNADILTTGYDKPDLDCIIDLKPTMSPGLHVQKLGRGTRPFYTPGFDLDTTEGRLESMNAGPKQNCLVLDYAGNTRRLGPINDPRIPRKKGEGVGDVPVKACGKCGCLHHISARECVNCGEDFTFMEKIEEHASTAVLIANDKLEVEVFDVDRVTYDRKTGAPGMGSTLQVIYYCGAKKFTQYLPFERMGAGRVPALDWWEKRTALPCPLTVHEVLEHVDRMPIPAQIRVWLNSKYQGKSSPKILAELFTRNPQNGLSAAQ